MAHKSEIERRLRAYEPMATVHASMRDKLPFHYSNFAKLVAKYLPDAVPKPAHAADTPAPGTGQIAEPPPPLPPPLPSLHPTPGLPPEPRQAVVDDRPRRFKPVSKTDDQLF